MNTDDITYAVPQWETEAERFEMDDSPLQLGELGAGFLIDPRLCLDGFPKDECPNGYLCTDRM